MPFYDYKCNKCGKKIEALHGMSGKPAGLKCEFCGSADNQRIFYPVGTMKTGAEPSASHSSGHSCSSCSSGSCGSCH